MGSGSLAKYVQFGFMYMYASYFVFCMQRRVILYQPALARDVKSVNRDNPAGHAKDILFGFC